MDSLTRTPKVFGIFSGGGIKGTAFVGAVEEARKYVQFAGWGGTSAGSIVAALLACGYSSDELKERLYAAPYSKFFSISHTRAVLFSPARGLIDPAPLLAWLREQIGVRFPKLTRVTFNDLKDDQYLKIVAANISAQKITVYSKRNTPNTEIAQAVLASCSFPFLFPAFIDGEDEIVDGGIFSNFPAWLFQDEEEAHKVFIPVLGFTLTSESNKVRRRSMLSYIYSIIEAALAAQDRVQDKYMDAPGFASVIRINVGDTPTFATARSRDEHNTLLLAGRDAASRYFESASKNYGQRVVVPAVSGGAPTPKEQLAAGKQREAVSAIARQHILHGGVALDNGPLAERILVRYYIDLMEAVTDHDKLDVLTDILSERIKSLRIPFDRIVGIKKGNIILAYAVAQKLKKPLSIFKSDMSYKMGQPFDGYVSAGERIIVVDDIASDPRFLLNPIRHLNFYNTSVDAIVTLLARTEGNISEKILKDKNVHLHAICSVSDPAIDNLIQHNTPFQCQDANGAPLF